MKQNTQTRVDLCMYGPCLIAHDLLQNSEIWIYGSMYVIVSNPTSIDGFVFGFDLPSSTLSSSGASSLYLPPTL